MDSETRNCQNCKQGFVVSPEDLKLYSQAGVPATKFCIDCNWAQLAAFWLLGRFRISKSALSGKQIITIIPETAAFPIYSREEFVSDAWDPMSYGQEYDPKKSFLDQLTVLQSKVPHPHQLGTQNINCDWTDDWWESKNCYLARSGYQDENLSYAYRVAFSKDGVDVTYGFNLEQSYDCLFCYRCWKVKYSFNLHDCVESEFLYDCRNCSNCFMSWNLRNKQYCILNQQYTKEEYEKKLKEYDLGSYKTIVKLKKEFWDHVANDAVHRENFNTQVTNCRGNFMDHDKNCENCSFFEQSDNCRQALRGFKVKDTIEAISPALSERSTRTMLDQFSYGDTCTMYSTNCRYSFYLDACEECEYCFGCVGMRKKKFCILNKQYTKEEYEKQVAKIRSDMEQRGEWGNFLPFAMAYGGYNVSFAQWIYPKTQQEAAQLGARWEQTPMPTHEGAIKSSELPDSIDTVNDSITKQRIICSESSLSYNIAPHELAFYKKFRIPLPQKHFDVRMYERFRPLSLMFRPHHGTCYFCKKEIEHYYDPELKFKKIACVDCYQKEIV